MRGLYLVYTPSFYESAVAFFATCSWLGLISVGYKIYTRDLIEQLLSGQNAVYSTLNLRRK
jgi:hypothetical protein